MVDSSNSTSGWQKWIKLAVLVAVVCLFAGVYLIYGDQLSLSELARHEANLRDFQQQHPVLIFALAFGLYVLVSGLSVPGGATVLSLAYAWFFTFWPALVLVSFASTTGATLAFLLSRYLFRDALMDRFGDRLKKIDESLEDEGAFYLFSLRLVPAFPFWIVNLIMGLTPLRTWTFWWVSQLGMLPGTIVYLFAGANVPSLDKLATEGPGNLWPVLIAFAILGAFPLIVKRLLKVFRAEQVTGTDDGR
jgi:uncharacterized membrane protein YdjX (TVP38/TMEM64 family)